MSRRATLSAPNQHTGPRIWGWVTAAVVLLAVLAAASRILTAKTNQGAPMAADTINNGFDTLDKLFNGVFGY